MPTRLGSPAPVGCRRRRRRWPAARRPPPCATARRLPRGCAPSGPRPREAAACRCRRRPGSPGPDRARARPAPARPGSGAAAALGSPGSRTPAAAHRRHARRAERCEASRSAHPRCGASRPSGSVPEASVNESPTATLAATGAVGARPRGSIFPCVAQGSDQSTGCAPCATRSALTRENGREPKNPRPADSGLGYDARRWARPRGPAWAVRVPAPGTATQRPATLDEGSDRRSVTASPPGDDRTPARPAGPWHPVQQHHPLVRPGRQVPVLGGATPTSATSRRRFGQRPGQRSDVGFAPRRAAPSGPRRRVRVLPDDGRRARRGPAVGGTRAARRHRRQDARPAATSSRRNSPRHAAAARQGGGEGGRPQVRRDSWSTRSEGHAGEVTESVEGHGRTAGSERPLR